jgi:hypothetical protein
LHCPGGTDIEQQILPEGGMAKRPGSPVPTTVAAALMVGAAACATQAPVALEQTCTNEPYGFGVDYPAGWETNPANGLPPCSAFDPEDANMPAATEIPTDIAIVIHREEAAFARVTDFHADPTVEPVSRRETTVDGRAAVAVELMHTGVGMYPEGHRYYGYFVDLGPATLIGMTHDVEAAPGPTYDDRRRILDDMMASLRFPAAPAPGPDPDPDMTPVEVGDTEVRGADGSVLLSIEDVPGDIAVDDDTEFGAATRFTEASGAPDQAWLAVATAGAAHSAAWLVRSGTRDPRPAAFQYGGGITIGPWTDDGRLVVFVQEGPAGDRTLTVVDRERLGDTVEASAMPVRVPDHDERRPEERIYEAVTWRDGRLVFQVGAERRVFDPATREVSPDP